ncbi:MULTISPECIES: enoyl-CoA hydratase-related protein [unclassified Haematobacter]|uniref:enoyl-CoA hydratase-related protein n=1 Tax=unclassified Haematobacter TaxID=2640585 RepID=UPI0025BE90A2|nr:MULTISPECIES: enoyl-CoA hydratase-related protein [unclassified Haematobacter]
MDFDDIGYEVAGRVAVIAFRRPEQLNAARMQTHRELIAALDAADADDAVRAVIVTGEGRAFCAGTDLTQGFDLPSGGDPATGQGIPPDVGGVTVLRLFRMRKPVIAAINGPAAGFGATFTLAMDIRLASEAAKFAFPFARRGICAESCSSWFLPRLVGMQVAQDWMLTGRTFPAAEALARGLVLEVLPGEALMPRACALAEEIASNCAPVSVALNRRLLWQMGGAAHPEEAHRLESRGIAATLAGPDAAEGVASFRDRRPPHFTGTVADADYMESWWPGN